MNRWIASCCLLAAFSLVGCDTVSTKTVTMRIDHYQQPCEDGAEPGFCLRVVDSSDPSVDLWKGINGFDHQWGYIYDVVVQVTENHITDEVTHDLVEVLDTVAAEPDSRFELVVAPEFIQRVAPESFDMIWNIEAWCDGGDVCRSVADALADDQAIRLELSHANIAGALIAYSAARTDG